MAVYPNNIKGDPGYTWTSVIDNTTFPTAAQLIEITNEITAMQEELGTNPSDGGSSYDTVKLRLAALEGVGNLLAGKKRRLNIQVVTPDEDIPPTQGFITGTVVETEVQWFNQTTDSKVHFNFTLPPEVNTSYDMTLIIDYAVPVNGAEGEEVHLAFYYLPCTTGTVLNTGAGEQSDEYSLSVASASAYYNYTEATNLTIASGQLSTGYSYKCTLLRDVDHADDDYDDDFGLINIALEFTVKDPTS